MTLRRLLPGLCVAALFLQLSGSAAWAGGEDRPGGVAPSAQSVLLEEHTWTELQAAIVAGRTVILVPVGGTEQNGPAMTLGKHNVRAKALAERIARELGNALVAPVLAYVPEGEVNPPSGHMRYPGTISVPERTFQETLVAVARSFRQHGFRHIVLLGDHGGYQRALAAVAQRLNREWADSAVRAHAIGEYYRAATAAHAAALRRRGYTEHEIGTHAGLADTSLMLAVDPAQVRTERLHDGTPLDAAHGVSGDPRRADAALGQVGVEIIVTRTVAAIRAALAQH